MTAPPIDFLANLPEGTIPLEFIFSVKCLDPEGNVCLYHERSSGLLIWEALGMATSLADDFRDALRGNAAEET